jgi:SAM-dependent methyltransferase
MRAHSSVIEKAKVAIRPLLNRSPRLRWWLAGTTQAQAFQSVCSTQNEIELDEIGRADAQRIIPILTMSSRVLDVGCGVGRLEKFLAAHCASIDAVDVSDRMLRIARTRLKGAGNVHFTRTNANNLRVFSDGTFDICLSFHCLQHMEKEDAWLALREIFRVLKQDGNAILHFPSFTSDTYFSLFEDERHWSDHSRVRAYTLPELEKMAKAAGFNFVRIDSICLNPFVQPKEPNRDFLVIVRK